MSVHVMEKAVGRIVEIMDETFPITDYPHFARAAVWTGNVVNVSTSHQTTVAVSCIGISKARRGGYWLWPGIGLPTTPVGEFGKIVTMEVAVKMIHILRHQEEGYPNTTMLGVIDDMVISALDGEVLARTTDTEEDRKPLSCVLPGVFSYSDKEPDNEAGLEVTYVLEYDVVIPPPGYADYPEPGPLRSINFDIRPGGKVVLT